MKRLHPILCALVSLTLTSLSLTAAVIPTTFVGKHVGDASSLTNTNGFVLGTLPNGASLTDINTGSLTNGIPGLAGPYYQFWFFGDSLTANYSSNGFNNSWVSWLAQMPRYAGVSFTNFAYGGAGIYGGTVQVNFTNQVYAALPLIAATGTGTQNVCFVWEGANDFPYLTATNWWVNYSNCLYCLKTNGVKLCCFTITPRAPITVYQETNRFVCNDILLSSGLWDYIVDTASLCPNNYNLNDYQADYVHFTTNAWCRVAQQVDAALVTMGKTSWFGHKEAGLNQSGTNFLVQNDAGGTLFAVGGDGSTYTAANGSFASLFVTNAVNLVANNGGANPSWIVGSYDNLGITVSTAYIMPNGSGDLGRPYAVGTYYPWRNVFATNVTAQSIQITNAGFTQSGISLGTNNIYLYGAGLQFRTSAGAGNLGFYSTDGANLWLLGTSFMPWPGYAVSLGSSAYGFANLWSTNATVYGPTIAAGGITSGAITMTNGAVLTGSGAPSINIPYLVSGSFRTTNAMGAGVYFFPVTPMCLGSAQPTSTALQSDSYLVSPSAGGGWISNFWFGAISTNGVLGMGNFGTNISLALVTNDVSCGGLTYTNVSGSVSNFAINPVSFTNGTRICAYMNPSSTMPSNTVFSFVFPVYPK